MPRLTQATSSPIIDPALVDFCDVPHWFDPGLTGVDTPHWLVSEALAAPAASHGELVALPRSSAPERAIAA